MKNEIKKKKGMKRKLMAWWKKERKNGEIEEHGKDGKMNEEKNLNWCMSERKKEEI